MGQPTRGKTFPNRLRRVDTFVLRYAQPLLRSEQGLLQGSLCVDLGYGAEPTTTLEMAHRLRRVNPTLRVVGVEIDAARVAAALSSSDALTAFRHGGFNVPLALEADGRPERVRLLRAFNVLRQYDEAAVGDAWARMGDSLLPDGLLIEGTSDPLGRMAVFNLLTRQPEQSARDGMLEAGADADADAGGVSVGALTHVALVFSTSLRVPFDPSSLQAVLPKNMIHRCGPGDDLAAFFETWRRAADATRAQREVGQRQWFVAAADELKARLQAGPTPGWRIESRRRWLRSGYLIVSLPPSIPPLRAQP